MGFKDAKKQVIRCLLSGQISHEMRNTIENKNLLQNGEVSVETVTELLKRASGSDYEARPHHFMPDIDVHIVKRQVNAEVWYIKWYYTSPDCIFISVHH